MFQSKVTFDRHEHCKGKCTFGEMPTGTYFVDLAEPQDLWIKLPVPVVSQKLGHNPFNCVILRGGLFEFKSDETPVQVRDVWITHAAGGD